MKKQILYSLLFLFMAINAFGWGGKAHKKITEYSWQKSDKLGNAMFLLSLNLDKGMLYEKLSDGNEEKSLDEWLQYGAEHEDDTDDIFEIIPDRSNYHFHNPLKYWWEAGLSDVASGVSAIYWAQADVLQKETSNKQGDRSWQKAREYYYKALTEAQYPTWRKNFFAEMFKILGHQVHLLQDMSVPDHVRNDTHVLNSTWFNKKNNSFRCIEGWAAADYNIGKIEAFASGAAPKPLIDFSLQIDPQSPVPIAFLSDTRQYKTSQTPSAGINQGLAEYTNANFVSENTICTDYLLPDHKHYFPFPKFSDTDIEKVRSGEKEPEYITAFDNKKDYVRYIKKEKNGESINHFLKLGYFSWAFPLILEKTVIVDDLCHKDFSSMLIPRAVGYSAALINYFFRGEIEVTLPVSDGIYSFCFVPAEGFKKISVMAKNITPDNEEMKSGQVSLIVSYRMGSSTPFVPNPPVPDVERIYKIIKYTDPATPDIFKIIDIPRDTPIRLDFDMTSNPLPTDAVDVTLTVVFKGDLGAEKTDAVAIGFKDISEPTPIDLYNHTDKVCFNNNYVNYDDPVLWAAVDVNPQNGKIDCRNQAEIDITRKRIGQQTKGVFVYFSFNGSKASVVRPTLLYIWRSSPKYAPPERSRRISLDFGCDFLDSL